jgi:DNA-binding winged helix-turn-helix (wHTH) protein
MLDDTYRFGEFSLSLRERRLFQGETCVLLNPKAFDTLHLLVRNHGSLVARSELFSTLWPGIHVTEANLTNIIVLLRKMLGRDAIQTVSKFGYRFTLPVTGEPGINQAAYRSFVRGKELLTQRSPEAITRARDLFWFCLAHDPQFGAAWAWLGRACHLLQKFSGPPGPDLAEAAFQRAFTIDPDLACAHQFYTQVQVDSGHAAQALIRLASRIKRRGEDPESLAGFVQLLRCCGLLDDSVAAHERALALDPTVKTSVAHTHFLRGEFARVFETYTGALYYLDAAAWAALGDVDRATSLLRARLSQPSMGSVMACLMSSLLAVLEGERDHAIALMQDSEGIREPEVLFYLARHYGMLHSAEPSIQKIRRARLAGFWSSRALRHDPAFTAARNQPGFHFEIEEALRLERLSYLSLRQTLGFTFAPANHEIPVVPD